MTCELGGVVIAMSLPPFRHVTQAVALSGLPVDIWTVPKRLCDTEAVVYSIHEIGRLGPQALSLLPKGQVMWLH